MESSVNDGDFVKIIFENGKSSIQRVSGGRIETHKGYVRIDELEQIRFGSTVRTNLGKKLVILRPTIFDLIVRFARRTQILYPKEMGYMLLALGIGPGSIVFEAGTGSGASAAFLAHFVKPNGRVISMDVNKESIDLASKNLSMLGLREYVDLRQGDVSQGIPEKEYFDAAIMDLPSPWEAMRAFWNLLKPSSRLAVVVPTYNQLEKTVDSLQENGFVTLECVDISVQGMSVKKGAVRPLPFARTHNVFLILAARTITCSY